MYEASDCLEKEEILVSEITVKSLNQENKSDR